MNDENKKTEKTWQDVEAWASETINQSKAHTKMWFAAWLITFLIFIGTNAAWIYVFQSYDYVSQDGSGLNSINTGTQGDLNNEPEGEN